MYTTNIVVALIRMQRKLKNFSDLTLSKSIATLLALSYATYVLAYCALYIKVSVTKPLVKQILTFTLLFATS